MSTLEVIEQWLRAQGKDRYRSQRTDPDTDEPIRGLWVLDAEFDLSDLAETLDRHYEQRTRECMTR